MILVAPYHEGLNEDSLIDNYFLFYELVSFLLFKIHAKLRRQTGDVERFQRGDERFAVRRQAQILRIIVSDRLRFDFHVVLDKTVEIFAFRQTGRDQTFEKYVDFLWSQAYLKP